MDNYKETFETWNKVAKAYQDKFMDLDLYNDTYDLFCNQITNSNSAILEIGCGPGNITKYLLAKRPDFMIDAIDIAPNMISLAKINNPTANCMVMDSRDIHLLEAKYDAIICGFCLPYLSELDTSKLIKDCYALLHIGGQLYLSFVEGEINESGFKVGGTGDRVFFYYHSLNGLNATLKANHFEPVHLANTFYGKGDGTKEMHTILIVKK